MKRLIYGTIFLLIGTTNLVLAQTKPLVSHATPNAVARTQTISTPTQLFNIQLRNTLASISKDTKSGKLTQSQAQGLRVKVKAVRVQEIQFMKINGNKQLTADQISQLNQQLSALAPSI
jgi:hypothetical protein